MDTTATTGSDKAQDDYLDKRRVTVVGAVINMLLAVAKVVFGIIGSSQSLIADGIHSLSDLASDAMVLVAAKYGSQGADADHPYGHARFETAATLGLGLLLFVVAAGIMLDAVDRLFSPDSLLQPGLLALVVAAVSILSKEALYHYTMLVARRLRSKLIRANAWHHRSDAVSSVVVFIGIAGTMAGLPYLDAIAAIGVSLMIAKIGWDLGWGGLRELVDTGLDPEELKAIAGTIDAVNGVSSHHMLRTRRMGEDVLVEVHIVVGSKVTVSEGHQISDRVRMNLKNEHENVTEIMVHIDPEDDAVKSPTDILLPREEIIDRLNTRWASLPLDSIEQVNLHYLEGKVNVEVLLPLGLAENLEQARQLADSFVEKAKNEAEIADVRVLFH
ncbi:MAG: cation transporter [Gammaproteobacteria bacterium]|nr:cation transporter [Gammaproteobacteria bacterium]